MLLGRPDEVFDVVEVDPAQVAPPRRHGLLAEQVEPAQPTLQHPLRLVLEHRDIAHDVIGEATLGKRTGDVGVGPAELVAAQLVEFLGATVGPAGPLGDSGPLGGSGHSKLPSVVERDSSVCGMWVVQTPSPCAIVASRWT